MLDIGASAVKPGVTTDEIDRIVHEVHSYQYFWYLVFYII